MKRRNLLIGLGTAAGSSAALLGTGAFSNTEVDRQMTIQVVGDENSFLKLVPGEANGVYTDDSGKKLVWNFAGQNTGLGLGSSYQFDETFVIENQAKRNTPLYVWTSVSSAAFGKDALYIYGDDPETPLNQGEAVEVPSGESVSLGVFIDTTGLDTDTYTPTVTVHAADEDPAGGDEDSPTPDPTPEPELGPVVLDSVSSLLNANGEPLTDGSDVAVFAESAATNTDSDGDGDAVSYPDGTDIPVVTLDRDSGSGDVVGITGPFVPSDTNFGEYANEQFLLNVYDELLGGSATVVHDEGHGQFYTLASNGGNDFQSFASYVENNGYTYEATADLASELSDADAAVITSPSEAFTDSELDALSTFVGNGGVVFLHDQSDFRNFDATDNLNEIAGSLDLDFRFNDDQVTDDENNIGVSFRPTTANYNVEAYPDFFRSVTGLDSN
jgi:hypothetical protein